MAKTAKTQTAPAAEELNPCACSFYSIERGDVPDGADPNEYLTFEGTHCNAETARTFAPGHDAKLKALLIKAGVEGASVRCELGGVASVASAETFAAKLDFGHMVLAGIVRAEQKLAERKDRAQNRAAAKATRDGLKLAAKQPSKRAVKAAVKSDPELVTIKVGRWTYAAAINEATNEATFTSANGEVKKVPATKYSIVTK